MMYKRILLLMGVVFGMVTSGSAQSALESLRYSSVYQVGTARNIALGGSISSVGGDFSSIVTNPAGIARYKSTEFQLSPNIVFGNTDGTYLGNSLSDENLNFNISSMGIIMARPLNTANGWKGFSIGAGLNRLDQYHQNIFISGTNTNSSILDLHAAVAEGVDPGSLVGAFPFDAGLSYLGNTLFVDTNNIYHPIFGNTSPEQDITISRSGGKYEAAISGGGNFNDQVYFGASLGVPIINFSETEIIRETDKNNEIEGFNYIDLRNELRTSGYGVNFKFGVLASVHEYVRIGAAFHTPTVIRFSDDYITVFDADFVDSLNSVESPQGRFDYTLVSPWKFIGNASFMMGKYGFISTEYELQNQGKAKYKFNSNVADVKFEESIRNNEISGLYDWQHHLKLGIEFKADPVRVRAGFQYKTSGFAFSQPAELIYSGGLGYRGKHFFVDGAFSYSNRKYDYTPYEFGNITSGTANLDVSKSQVTITIGYKL